MGFPDDAGKGATIEVCELEAAPAGVEVGGVQFDDQDGGYFDDQVYWWA